MTPIGHLAIGFAAKPAGPKIPLGVLLAASWLLDFLYPVFAFTGIESAENFTKPGAAPSPWSHGLLLALVWSMLAGLLAWRVYRSQRNGVIIALVVFSHWALDFLAWDNLFLLLGGSQQVGLGWFSALGSRLMFVEVGLIVSGLVVFWLTRRRVARRALA